MNESGPMALTSIPARGQRRTLDAPEASAASGKALGSRLPSPDEALQRLSSTAGGLTSIQVDRISPSLIIWGIVVKLRPNWRQGRPIRDSPSRRYRGRLSPASHGRKEMAEETEGPNRSAEKRSFKLGIDYEKNRLVVDLAGSLDWQDVSKLMAFLSHCQHVLVLSSAGQRLDLPIDPNIAFKSSPGGYALGSHDTIVQYSVGIDHAMGMVGMTVLGASDRLSGYRIPPDMARRLAGSLVNAADQTPQRPTPVQ